MLPWLIVLVIVPLFLYVLRGGERVRVKNLSVSEFENMLKTKQIISVVAEEQDGGGIVMLTGSFKPSPDSAPQPYRTRIIYTQAVDEAIRANCPSRDVKAGHGLLMNLLMSVLPFLVISVILYIFFARQLQASGRSAMMFGKSRARKMDEQKNEVRFKDVAGITEAKEEVQEIVEYLKDPKKFQRLGGKVPHGVLMVGPPGTGKTLLARAIAGEAKVPFYTISGSDFVELFVGVGASRVRDMFEEGKRNAPCLIFIDEIDAVGRSRFSGIGGGHDEREQTLNAMLVEMDGFEANSGVIVLAATNRPDVLDPALLRPGRFDRQVTIDLPDMEGRVEILKVHAAKFKVDESVDLTQIARGTPGFSGADLANLLNEAAIMATRRDKEAITLDELEEARDKVCWGRERKSRRLTDKQRRLTAYHEAGHTIVNLFCKHAEPLHKVSIIPRGMAMGATMFLPEQDRYNITENEALDMMAVGMGGRCAERIIFDEISSGATMDIRQATATAHKMVCQWGMSGKMGPLNYEGREDHIYLGRDITRTEGMSPETAREIDLEVRRLVDEAQERAMKILTENRARLEKLAEELLVKETLNAPEVYALLEIEKDA